MTRDPEGGAIALGHERLPAVPPQQHMTSRQLRHLAESARLEERPDHIGSVYAIWAIAGSLIAFLVWASFARLPEVARAPGEIRPLGLERAIQLPQGGTLRTLSVRDGDEVRAGQAIAQLDDRAVKADLRVLEQQARSLSVQEEWMLAFIENRTPDFSRLGVAPDDPEVLNGARAYGARMASMEDRGQVLRQQISRLETDLDAVRGEIAAQEARVASEGEVLKRQEGLYDQRLVAFAAIAAARQSLTDAEARLNTLGKRETATERQREEVVARLNALTSSEQVSVRETLQTTRADLAEARARMDALREDIHDRRIVTPISGTVTIPDDLAPGDFVMPGAPIAFVVPTDTELVARVRVPATEISRVEVGQTAEVKVDALDFTRYGRITGTVRTLSPSALVSEQGQVYYMAEVGLDSDRLSDGIVTHELRPGMGVQAELINGSRTILAYLFKPVEQALDSAFKEE